MAGRIEFLDPVSGDAEEPAAPPPHASPPNRRRALLVIVVAAALVIVVLVVRAAGSSDNAAPPAPTVTPTVSSPVSPTATPTSGSIPDPAYTTDRAALLRVLGTPSGLAVAGYCPGDPTLAGSILRTGTTQLPELRPTGQRDHVMSDQCTEDAAFCPEADDGQSACVSTDAVPAGLLTSVRRLFPKAALARTVTETVRETHHLWYRLMLFALPGGATLRVDVILRHDSPPGTDERENASGTFARVVGSPGTGLLTLVTLGSSGGATVDLRPLTALAGAKALARAT